MTIERRGTNKPSLFVLAKDGDVFSMKTGGNTYMKASNSIDGINAVNLERPEVVTFDQNEQIVIHPDAKLIIP